MLAQPGLNGHDQDALLAALSFRDAGFEVVYTGCHQTPEKIVSAAVQEDVDLIWLNMLSEAYGHFLPRVLELLSKNNSKDMSVAGGCSFPIEDIPKLKEIGVKEIFDAGAKLECIVDWVSNNIMPGKG